MCKGTSDLERAANELIEAMNRPPYAEAFSDANFARLIELQNAAHELCPEIPDAEHILGASDPEECEGTVLIYDDTEEDVSPQFLGIWYVLGVEADGAHDWRVGMETYSPLNSVDRPGRVVGMRRHGGVTYALILDERSDYGRALWIAEI